MEQLSPEEVEAEAIENCVQLAWDNHLGYINMEAYLKSVFLTFRRNLAQMRGPWAAVSGQAYNFTIAQLEKLADDIVVKLPMIRRSIWANVAAVLRDSLIADMNGRTENAAVMNTYIYVVHQRLNIAQLSFFNSAKVKKTKLT